MFKVLGVLGGCGVGGTFGRISLNLRSKLTC